ncbi:Bax inhibitor-1/YccA family protein [Candidatus Odyssella thessalonicensis]|uniref:Bax inhibitor-1/YccA family protein n=1 Tax=Candidatus Odyssella thessalonicensis TaxID=84647 RepID=UPI000225B1D2|nr:Bax inhibitor-1/YccA family protein [Candidatus Odyssella thessalonicensis]
MSYENRTVTRSGQFAAFESGLRGYMQRVFAYMGLGLAVTGVAGFLAATVPALHSVLYASPMLYVVLFAPLALVFFLSFRIERLSLSTAQTLFWVYAVLVGFSLTPLVSQYTGESVTRIFFITASTFGAMALYGYTTQKDLTSMGSFMFMGLMGIVIASLVNIFLKSSAMSFVLSALSVIVFTGLTAYDTQRIKDLYYDSDSAETAGKKAVMGALTLYLDFINIFISLLRLFGDRRDD